MSGDGAGEVAPSPPPPETNPGSSVPAPPLETRPASTSNAAVDVRTGPRPLPIIMQELKDATGAGVDVSKIGEAATAICEELGVDSSGTVKEKAHRAAAEVGVPITYEDFVTAARVELSVQKDVKQMAEPTIAAEPAVAVPVATPAASPAASPEYKDGVKVAASTVAVGAVAATPDAAAAAAAPVSAEAASKVEAESVPGEVPSKGPPEDPAEARTQPGAEDGAAKGPAGTKAAGARADDAAKDGDVAAPNTRGDAKAASADSDASGGSEGRAANASAADETISKEGTFARVQEALSFDSSGSSSGANGGGKGDSQKFVEVSPEGRYHRSDKLLGHGTFKRIYQAYGEHNEDLIFFACGFESTPRPVSFT